MQNGRHGRGSSLAPSVEATDSCDKLKLGPRVRNKILRAASEQQPQNEPLNGSFKGDIDRGIDMDGCQNYGPFLSPYKNAAPSI